MSLGANETLKTFLLPQFKALKIVLKADDNNEVFLSTEMTSELERLFTWLTVHSEIQAVWITSEADYFAQSPQTEVLANLSFDHVNRLFDRIKSLSYSMLFLPQTFVIDLKKGAKGIAAEFLLGADMRVGERGLGLHFNHLEHGLVPSCGAMALLGHLSTPAMARSWLLSGLPVDENSLVSSGLVHTLYENRDLCMKRILSAIHRQSPVARMQLKRGLLQLFQENVDKSMQFENEVSRFAPLIEDWQKKLRSGGKHQFMGPKEFSGIVKNLNKEKVN